MKSLRAIVCSLVATVCALVATGSAIAGEGATDAVKVSADPFVHQFIRGKPDGPVPFHYPSDDYAADMGLQSRAA